MKIAIVILNWNGKTLLEKFLPAIIRYSPMDDVDIYLADNASTDTSIEFVKRHFPSIKILKNPSNWGYAKGYNEALKHIKSDVYALVNSDIEVTENWLVPIKEHFQKHPDTAIVQPKILDYKRKSYFEYAGAGGGFIDKLGYPYCRGRIFTTLEKDQGQYDDTASIFWASGACLFIRSEVFHKLGGFDTDYFAHQEEIDLCWRVFNAGYRTMYVGKSTVYHVGGASLKEASTLKTFLNFRNSLYNITKNIPDNNFLWVLFQRIILDSIAGIKFLLEGKFPHIWAIVKAHFSYYAHFRKMVKKRTAIPNKRKDYYTLRSIVWRYFAMGKRNL